MMWPLPPAVDVGDFPLDEGEDVLVQGERRLVQPFQRRRAHEARELQEDLVDVLRQNRVGAEQAVVGVQARRARVVVAGAEVHVALQPRALATHDQRHLAVGLVADHAVDDMRAGFLQPVRQVDVLRLVEARAQLDDHGDFLAGLGGRHQAVDDRRLVAGRGTASA